MKRPPQEAEHIREYYHAVFDDLYTFASQNLVAKMELLECNYITQVINFKLFDFFSLMNKFYNFNVSAKAFFGGFIPVQDFL